MTEIIQPEYKMTLKVASFDTDRTDRIQTVCVLYDHTFQRARLFIPILTERD